MPLSVEFNRYVCIEKMFFFLKCPIMGNERFLFWFWESPTTG